MLPKLQAIRLRGLLRCDDNILVNTIHSRWRQSLPRLMFVGLAYHRQREMLKSEIFREEGLALFVEEVPMELQNTPLTWPSIPRVSRRGVLSYIHSHMSDCFLLIIDCSDCLNQTLASVV